MFSENLYIYGWAAWLPPLRGVFPAYFPGALRGFAPGPGFGTGFWFGKGAFRRAFFVFVVWFVVWFGFGFVFGAGAGIGIVLVLAAGSFGWFFTETRIWPGGRITSPFWTVFAFVFVRVGWTTTVGNTFVPVVFISEVLKFTWTPFGF
jgi:hypothetical protein